MPALASCHGSVRYPPARNVLANSNGCMDCLNAGGISEVFDYNIHRKQTAKYGVCGDPFNGPRDHEAGGKFAKRKIAGKFSAGQTVPITFEFSANHGGRMSVSLCVLPNGPMDSKRERSLTTQKCFDAHRLVRTDGSPYTYLLGTEKTVNAHYKLPKGVTCEHCVLQWFWITGNSCCPPNTPAKFCEHGVDTCFRNWWNLPEEWWNCSDIQIA